MLTIRRKRTERERETFESNGFSVFGDCVWMFPLCDLSSVCLGFFFRGWIFNLISFDRTAICCLFIYVFSSRSHQRWFSTGHFARTRDCLFSIKCDFFVRTAYAVRIGHDDGKKHQINKCLCCSFEYCHHSSDLLRSRLTRKNDIFLVCIREK